MTRSYGLILVTAIAIAAGCSKSPVAPQEPAVTTVSLAITGPDTMEPRPLVLLPESQQPHGPSQQFRARATFSDGTSKDITTTATWMYVTVGAPTTVQTLWPTDTPGLAESGRPGEANVVVLYENKSVSHHVLVIKPGTFTLSGRVRTSDRDLIVDGSVTIQAGINEGLSVPVELNGRFALYGVAGPTDLRVVGQGFVDTIEHLDVSGETTRDFDLAASVPTVDVSGPWSFTLKASQSCRNSLPEAARERSYDLTITQTGKRLTTTFSRATIATLSDPPGIYHDSGSIRGDLLSLGIYGDTDYGDWSYPLFFENLGGGMTLGLSIGGDGTVTSGDLVIPAAGDIEVWSGTSTSSRPGIVCRANDHLMVLSRK